MLTEKRLKKELESSIQGLTPGILVQAYYRGEKQVDLSLGETFPYYDWASLTKPIFTTTYFMHLYEEKPRLIEDRVLTYLPWFFKTSITIRHLLTHTSGLTWWKPYYQVLDLKTSVVERREFLKTLLSKEEVSLFPKAVYSDLNYILLGYLMEELSRKNLVDIWSDFQNEFKMQETFFHFNNEPKFEKNKYAPTEECPWRKIRLQGEVHDENAWAMGGVSTHSGLFGPMEDLSRWILYLRNVFLGNIKSSFVSQETLQAFFGRSISRELGDWALGFMMRSEKDSSAGDFFSFESIGHTGFTGTSFWYDPTNDLIVLILANRVYYGRDKKVEFKNLRAKIHNICFEGLVEP